MVLWEKDGVKQVKPSSADNYAEVRSTINVNDIEGPFAIFGAKFLVAKPFSKLILSVIKEASAKVFKNLINI